MKRIRVVGVLVLLVGLFPALALAQSAESLGDRSDGSRSPAVNRAPAPDALYEVAAVVATGLNIPVRQAVCGVGEVLGFFVGSVARLPVWALTLGDRLGSSEPLSRVGTSVVEKACDAPWLITADQMRNLGRSVERSAPRGPAEALADGP